MTSLICKDEVKVPSYRIQCYCDALNSLIKSLLLPNIDVNLFVCFAFTF